MTTRRTTEEVQAIEALLRSTPEGKALLASRLPRAASLEQSSNQAWGVHRLFDMDELDSLLAESKNGPRDAYDIIKRYLDLAKSRGAWRKLPPSPTVEKLAALKLSFPNFSSVIDDITRSAALAKLTQNKSLGGLRFLLLGEAGVGKTRFAKELAMVLATDYLEISMATATAGFVLAGHSFGWSNGAPGVMFKSMTSGSCSGNGNPLVVIDELDKASSDTRHSPVGPLYELLEPASNARWRDEAISLALDLSQINWFATANEANLIDEPLRNRFRIHRINAPTRDQNVAVVASVYADLRRRHGWGSHFPETLNEDVLHALLDQTPRDAARVLLDAAGAAALANRKHIEAQDIRILSTKSAPIRFV